LVSGGFFPCAALRATAVAIGLFLALPGLRDRSADA
jgi:hypothetical protein